MSIYNNIKTPFIIQGMCNRAKYGTEYGRDFVSHLTGKAMIIHISQRSLSHIAFPQSRMQI